MFGVSLTEGVCLLPKQMSALIVLVTTSGPKEARKITRALVREKLAACVNVIPRVGSTYWWRGKVETAREALMIIKTTSSRFPALEKRVRALHSYSVPEIIAYPVERGNPDYLAWIKNSLL